MTPTATTVPEYRRPSRSWLWWLGAGVIVYVAACGCWVHYINSVPPVNIPNPRLPQPNAFDFYERAGKMVVPRVERDRLGFSTLEPAKPVPSGYLAKASWPQKERWLARHQQVFALLRQGFHYTYRQPPSRSLRDQLPFLTRFREVGRLLIIASQTRAHNGDWDGAVASASDAFQFAHDIPRGGPITAMATSLHMQFTDCRQLRTVLPHLNSVQARWAAGRLERILATRTPFAELLREEKWTTQAGLLELMRSHQMPDLLDGIEDSREIWLHTRFMNYHAIMRNYSVAMDAQIASARRPYNAMQPVPAVRPSLSDPITVLLDPEFTRSRFQWLRTGADNALLMVELALRAFRLNHGRFPQTLDQLAPAYLRQVPDDPFGSGESLRYRLRPVRYVIAIQYVPAPASSPAAIYGYPGSGSMALKPTYATRPYTLYSIGPDGVDAAGVPVDSGKTDERSPMRRYIVPPDGRGDIVAGVNY